MQIRVFKFCYLKILRITEIKNPIKPIIRIPKADIFATSLNSLPVGFLRICQTLVHCTKKDFKVSIIAMKIKVRIGLKNFVNKSF